MSFDERKKGLSAADQKALDALGKERVLEDEVLEAFELKYGALSASNFAKLAPYVHAKASKRVSVASSPIRTMATPNPFSPAANKRRLPALAVTPESLPKKAKGSAIWSPGLYSPEKSPAPFSRTPGKNDTAKSVLNGHLPKGGAVPVEVQPGPGMYRCVTSMPATWSDGFNGHVERLEQQILAAPELQGFERASVGEVSSTERRVVTGRIVCEVEFTENKTKLNEQSLLLEGSRASSNGAKVELRTSRCPMVQVVPGQVVAAVGTTDQQGKAFLAEQLLIGAPVEPCTRQATVAASLVVAAGPFTPNDSLGFEGLDQVATYVEQEKPGVVVLLGPFLEASHKHVAAGVLHRGQELGLQGQPASFQDVYEVVIFPKLKKLAGLGCQLVIVPALSEVGLPCPALPQPTLAFKSAEWARLMQMPNVHAASNPCELHIAGLRFAVSAQDPFLPVLADQLLVVREGPKPQPIEAALDTILAQRTFFPVHPAPRGHGIRIAPTRIADLEFGELPDVVLCGSRLNAFAKTRRGRVFINPGHAAKGSVWGTLAAVHIAPGRPVEEAVRVDVVKL